VIPPYEFWFKFLEMKKENSKKSTILLENFQELKIFTLTKAIEQFSDSIGKISTLCFI